MPFLLILAVSLWFVFGDPLDTLADSLWTDAPAPWERVDAYYYPDNGDLTKHQAAFDVGGLDGCREWAYWQAAAHNDPGMLRSSYECGVGPTGEFIGSLTVYRITAE